MIIKIIIIKGIEKNIIKIILNIIIIFRMIYLKYYKELLILNNY